jgi:hypothetical protein
MRSPDLVETVLKKCDRSCRTVDLSCYASKLNTETGSPARPTIIVEKLTVKLDAQQLSIMSIRPSAIANFVEIISYHVRSSDRDFCRGGFANNTCQ